MSLKFAVVMDPIEQINPEKDTSFALLLAAQQRGYTCYYIAAADLYSEQGVSYVQAAQIKLVDRQTDYLEIFSGKVCALHEFDVILMRKDPPFDMRYIYLTYMLELASQRGTLVLNPPQALRDYNEKFILHHFPEYCPPTLVSAQTQQLSRFIEEQQHVVLKPLDGMGGQSLYFVQAGDVNAHVILEQLTAKQHTPIMAQGFISAVSQGDKRIILIDGEAVPYGLTRLAQPGQLRSNLAAGGTGRAQALTSQEQALCAAIGPKLRQMGLIFVGLDVIGGYITEINITSPTCVREIERAFAIDICGNYLDWIEQRIKHKQHEPACN